MNLEKAIDLLQEFDYERNGKDHTIDFLRFVAKELEEYTEDKRIEKIDLSEWAEITYSEDWKMLTYDFNRNSNLFVEKINEIIDYINEEK